MAAWWLWWGALGSAGAAPLTLAEALDESLRANLELRQAALDRDQSTYALQGTAGTFDPALSGSLNVSQSRNPTNNALSGVDQIVSSSASWSAGVSQLLPSGGTVGLTFAESTTTSNDATLIEATTVSDGLSLTLSQPLLRGFGPAALYGLQGARIGVTDAELGWRAAVEQQIISTASAYWRLVTAARSHQLAIRSREIAERSLTETEERLAEGFAGTGDLHQVERALGAARQAEVIAEAEVRAADLALRRQLGRAVDGDDGLEPVDVPAVPDAVPSGDEVLALARERNAAWLRARLAAERARIDVRSARNSALPSVDAFGSVGLSGLGGSGPEARQEVVSGDFSDWSLGVSTSVQLPARTLRADLNSARADEQRARLDLEAAEQDLVLQVRDAVRAAERDRLRVELARDTERFARLALEAQQELLADGRGATFQVVQALEDLDRAQADALRAQIDLQTSLLEVRRVAGTLIGPDEDVDISELVGPAEAP